MEEYHLDNPLGEWSWLTASNCCPTFRSTVVFNVGLRLYRLEAAQSPWLNNVGVQDPDCFLPKAGLLRWAIFTRGWGKGSFPWIGLVKIFSKLHPNLRLWLPSPSSFLLFFCRCQSCPPSEGALPVCLSFPNKPLVHRILFWGLLLKRPELVCSLVKHCFVIFTALRTTFECIQFNWSAYLFI